jgi:hypothetical protein
VNPRYSNREKALCAEREVQQRRRVYPWLVESGKVSQQFCDRQIAMMTEIADEYREKAEKESEAGRLF